MNLAILFLLMVVTSAFAQPRVPASLELGKLKVRLGMSKAEIISAATKLGYKVHEDETSGYVSIVNSENGGDYPYSAKFVGGRLVYATRSWKEGQRDEWRALMGALSTVENQSCRVHTAHQSKPGFNYNAYFLDCGEHSVYVEESISGDGERHNDVGEIIGDPNGSP
jgi:hypothetical protein